MLAVPSVISLPVEAQIYSIDVRPPGISYRVARTDHFDLIYQSGFEREAARTGALLEAGLPSARKLVGTKRRVHLPVVLNAFNDRSNGFVASFPFKMEIEIPSLKGNRLSPRHSSWLYAVAPHELVHAVHAEFGSGLGAVGLMRLFAPDMSRMLNLMVPSGIAEGIAVFFESEGPGRSGRLNHALFQMEFRAAMMADRPWSLAQMLERPAYSIPGDRYYHGGAFLYSYLYDRDRGETFRRAQGFHFRFPFLGYGVSLWAGGGHAPWLLGRDFRLKSRQDEIERQLRLGQITEARVVASTKGLVHRRPQWLDDDEVVAYVSGYHTVPGFYRINMTTGRREHVSSQYITEDALFTLSPNRREVLFSRYVTNPLVQLERVAEVYSVDVASGSSRRITRGGHVASPAMSIAGEIWGTRDAGTYSMLVRAGRDIKLPAVVLPPRITIRSLAWSPVADTLALLVNLSGVQGLHLVYREGGIWKSRPVLTPRQGVSILDFSWLADGHGFVFTSDESGVANLFYYSIPSDTIVQLTNARYGAFEGSVSPDGSRLAFVDYQHERWNLATIPFDPSSAREVPREYYAPAAIDVDAPGGLVSEAGQGETDGLIESAESHVNSNLADDSGAAPATTAPDDPAGLFAESADTLAAETATIAIDSRPYHAVNYLAPRELFPVFSYAFTDTEPGDVDLGIGVGAAVAGSDPLQKWSYAAAGWYQADELWGRFTLQSGASVLRPSLSAFRTPSTRVVRTNLGVRRVGKEEEGVAAGVTLPVTLSSNVYHSAVTFVVAGQYGRSRYFGPSGSALTPFDERATIAPGLLAQIGVHSNRRDIRIRRGLVVGVSALGDVWSNSDLRTAAVANARLFFPSVPGSGGSFSLIGGYLWQSEPAIYDLDFFLPRGLGGTFLPEGSHVKYGIDLVQPLAFVDNGLVILPIYLKSIYLYGFAESVRPAGELTFGIDSVGGGLGIELRLLYLLNLDLRFGAAYLPGSDSFEFVFR